jgi:hypothetical protein
MNPLKTDTYWKAKEDEEWPNATVLKLTYFVEEVF